MIEVVRDITYPGFRFTLTLKMGLVFLYMEPEEGSGRCSKSGDAMAWKSRKWYISPHKTKSEIVQTAFLCAKTAMEHELRETFTYKGVTVLDPHLDLDHLAIVKSERLKPI